MKRYAMNRGNIPPAIYKCKMSGLVTTWDIRIKKSNQEDYISNEIMHTIEHTLENYLVNNYGSYRVLGVFPMGSQIGFRVMTRFFDKSMIYNAIIDYIFIMQRISGVEIFNERDCDNPRLHDVKGTKRLLLDYYDKHLRYLNSAKKYD